MEYLEVFDRYGKTTGRLVDRRTVHERGLWHRVVHIWVYNSGGEVLIQKRSSNKDSHPNLWDVSAAGHIDPGELPVESAIRELKEELGIDADANKLKFIGTLNILLKDQVTNTKDNEITYIYLYFWDDKIESLEIDKNEVSEVKLVNFQELKKLLLKSESKKDFVFFGNEYFNLVFKELSKAINSQK